MLFIFKSNLLPDTFSLTFISSNLMLFLEILDSWMNTKNYWDGIKHMDLDKGFYAAFRLAWRSPHCRFDDEICTTVQAPLAAEGWPSGKQHLANRSITLPLCPPRQIADSWILFNLGVMPLGDKAKAAWPLRAVTLKQQAMITWRSGKAASGKLVWNRHYLDISSYSSAM